MALRLLSALLLFTLANLGLWGCDSRASDDIGPPGGGGDGGVEIERITHYSEDDGLAWSQAATSAICPNGDVWFGYGVGGNGITRYDGTSWQTLTNDDGLPHSYVYALACDDSNNLWSGNGASATGLTRYDGTSWITFTEADGLASDYIESIAVGPDGNLWVTFGIWSNGVDRVELR